MKRGRESDDESFEEGSSNSQTPITEEEISNVVMALLNARFYSRPLKGSAFSELAPHADKSKLVSRVNAMLEEGTMLEMVRIPERLQTGPKKAAPRNEYILRTRMPIERQRVVCKYSNPGTLENESKMLHIVALVVAGGEVPEPQLIKSMVGTGLADEHDAQLLIGRATTLRLLEQREDVMQGGKKLAMCRVGPTASALFTKKALFDYLFDFMEYSEDTQTHDMLERNKEILKRKVDAALPLARD